MRLVFYLFLISQLFNFIGVFAEKLREDTSGLNTINWKKIEENKSKPIKKIIWRSYKNDEAYFGNKNKEDSISGTTDLSNEEEYIDPQKYHVLLLPKLNLFCHLIISLTMKIYKALLDGNHLLTEV